VPIASPGSVDPRNAEIPALCGFPGGRLVDGVLTVEESDDGFVGVRLEEQVLGDVDGDGVAEVAARLHCYTGGSAQADVIAVYRGDLTLIGVYDPADTPPPRNAQWFIRAGNVVAEPGTFRVDIMFSEQPTDTPEVVQLWLSVVDGVLHRSLAGEAPVPVGSAPVPTGVWTFDGDWLDAVPQLGNEPVRGSGCGADGSIGDVIPDGWWFGLVTSSDGAQFGFTLGCAYYGESAQSYLEECGEECEWVESFMPRFYTDRVWTVPTETGIVKELTQSCAASAAALESQFLSDGRSLLSWIHVVDGRVDYVRYSCPIM
jgi:hypothetical protein